MNIENILKVADAIEKHEVPGLGFNMGEVVCEADGFNPDFSGAGCGTVACIAGWAIALESGAEDGDQALNTYMDTGAGIASAADWLGLPFSKSDRLFFARGADASLRDIKPEQAVAVLRHLAATGKVDWTVAA